MEQASNTARGTSWETMDLRHYEIRIASMWRHVEARGSTGAPASRAPSDLSSERRWE